MPPVSFNMDFGVTRDPKIVRLVASLGSDAFLAWVSLLGHATEHHWKEDGRLDGYTAAEIEAFVHWRGSSGAFVAALLRLGLLEEIENGFAIPHMGERNPHFAANREATDKAKAAAEKRWGKSKASKSDDETPSDAHQHAWHMPNGQSSICPNDNRAYAQTPVEHMPGNAPSNAQRREEKRREINTEDTPPTPLADSNKGGEGEKTNTIEQQTNRRARLNNQAPPDPTEEPRPTPTLAEIDRTPRGVAQRFCFRQTGRRFRELEDHVTGAIEAAVACGSFTLEEVAAEVDLPETERDLNETFAQLKFRLSRRREALARTANGTGNKHTAILDHLNAIDFEEDATP